MAILFSTAPTVQQRKFSLSKEPCVIGRHPECDVQIDEGAVSRKHAQVVYQDGNYYLEDLDSRNGTFLNDQQVHQPTKLYNESEIRICDTVIVFKLSDQTPSIANYGSPTAERGKIPLHTSDSVLIDDDGETNRSRIMSRLEAPSHHSKLLNRISAEQKLEALTKITYALSESVERDQVLTRILDCLFELFVEADRGFIILRNADGRLQPLGFKSRRSGNDEQIRISRTIVNQVMETKTAIISSDASSDDRFDMAQSMVEIRIRSIMCAPLINSQDVSIGVIQLDTLKQSINSFKEEDLETLVTVAMQASLAIQKSDLFEENKKSLEFKTDLALAHELQQRFLPQRPPSIDAYEFYSHYRPMQQVGGDYYDYIPLSGNRLAIITADVVGHGIAAALLMAKVSAESRFALATSSTAVEAIEKMNANLSDLNIDRFVTLALVLLNTETHEMTIVNAGHMAPILRKADGTMEQLAIEQAGLPLGILEGYPYEAVEIKFDPGDVLIMYTDGINEAVNDKDEQLTTETMIQEIRNGQAKNSVAIGELLHDSVKRHIGSVPPFDDMCIVCLGRKGI